MMIFDIRLRALAFQFSLLKKRALDEDIRQKISYTCVGPKPGGVRSARGSFAESFPFGFKRPLARLTAMAREGAD